MEPADVALCAVVGLSGLALAVAHDYPLLLTWLLAAGALWLWLALDAWIDGRMRQGLAAD